jgi:GT2 family glycosyltransferase
MATRQRVAVIVCAYTLDRLDDLTDCIESLHTQSTRPDEIVVVVDHNEVLSQRVRRLAQDSAWNLAVVDSLGTPGLSGARNSGIAATNCELLLFIDDDAVADPAWLDEMVAPFAVPTVSAVGGRIDPAWPDRRPDWFPPHLDWTVGCSIPTLPDDGGPIRNMYGASAAFRRSELEAIGGFPTELGRVGADGAGCEETEVCIRIRQRTPTAQVWYAPRSRVSHRVTDQRATVGYVLRRCLAEGKSKAMLSRRVGADVATSDERDYAVHIARAVGGDLRAALRTPSRLRRATVLVAGLGAAAAGYLMERARR